MPRLPPNSVLSTKTLADVRDERSCDTGPSGPRVSWVFLGSVSQGFSWKSGGDNRVQNFLENPMSWSIFRLEDFAHWDIMWQKHGT